MKEKRHGCFEDAVFGVVKQEIFPMDRKLVKPVRVCVEEFPHMKPFDHGMMRAELAPRVCQGGVLSVKHALFWVKIAENPHKGLTCVADWRTFQNSTPIDTIHVRPSFAR